MLPLSLWLLLALVGLAAGAGAADFFVSPEGDDAWTGRRPKAGDGDGPFRSLARAAEALQPGDTCHLRAGVYREVLRPARSGEPDRPITFRAYQGETPQISATEPVRGWRRGEGGAWVAPLTWDLGDGTQLFVGDTMLTEARWPNSDSLFQPERALVESGTETSLVCPTLPADVDWTGALLWLASGSEWICQSVTVTGFDPATHTLTFEPAIETNRWYLPRKDNLFVLMGVRGALDAEGEWWLDRDAGELHLIPLDGADPNTLDIAAKQRDVCIDLTDRRHIVLDGLAFTGGALRMDGASASNVLDNLRGEWLGHSYHKDISGTGSVLIAGHGNTVRNCRFAHASGSVLRVTGSEQRVINCLIEAGDYAGKWNGTVALTGRRQLFSHNTVRDSGRDLVSVHGLAESLVQHNDLSNAGWLTSDLGMTYGHNTDFAGTVFRHNRVHDNRARHTQMGIYFDHLSHNAIVYGNVVWNVKGDPIRFNNPGYHNLVYNNTCYNTGPVRTFDHSKRNDLYGCRFINNLFNQEIKLPEHVVVATSLTVADPGYVAPNEQRFMLKDGSDAIGTGTPLAGITGTPADLGAYRQGVPPWRAGHDFAAPPDPEPVWERVEVPGMNRLANAAFEIGGLEGWRPGGDAKLAPGNGWGNNWGRGEPFPTGTSKHELHLVGAASVEQTVEGLLPNTRYELSGWLRTASPGEPVSLAVSGPGLAEVTAQVTAASWTRTALEFTTGDTPATVVVAVAKAAGAGEAWADNLALVEAP